MRLAKKLLQNGKYDNINVFHRYNNKSMNKLSQKSYIQRFIFFFASFILIWAFCIEPNIITTQYYKIKDNNLSGIRLVFASDLHLKKNHGKRLLRIISKINSLNADVVILGGDYVDGINPESSMNPEEIGAQFSHLKSKYGSYAVLGNHDWWYDGEQIADNLSKNKINVLLNESLLVRTDSKVFYIAGVEDMMTREADLNKTLKNTKGAVILVSHYPDIFDSVPSSVNLTLSGHTHGGQIAIPFVRPFWIPCGYKNKDKHGLIIENSENSENNENGENGKKMILSTGLGTSIAPVRFNCFPEIVVVDFY